MSSPSQKNSDACWEVASVTDFEQRQAETMLQPDLSNRGKDILMNAKAIILDAEGVVIDTEGIWDIAQEELLHRRMLKYQRSLLKPRLTGLGPYESMLVLIEHYNLNEEPEKLIAERRSAFRVHSRDRLKFIPGFEEAFPIMCSGWKMCLASSMDVELLAYSDSLLGLSALFDNHIYSTSSAGCRSKPAPDLFLHAAEGLQVDPHDCLVIEDAPSGIAAARAAGMSCIGLATTNQEWSLLGANLIVSHLQEIFAVKKET